MNVIKTNVVLGFAIVVLLFPIGCGKGHVGLSGRVTYSDTDEPLEAGTVVLATTGFYTRGEIKEDGRYTIGSYSEKDGLPPGTYKVYISGASRLGDQMRPDGTKEEIPRIDPKFGDPDQSGLTCEVTNANKTFDFKVDCPK